MGTAAAKAFGDMLLGNKTIQTLDVSDNSFGRPVVGDHVKLKSSGEIKVVNNFIQRMATKVVSIMQGAHGLMSQRMCLILKSLPSALA